MNQVLRTAFEQEMALARQQLAVGALGTAFAHLERAHVLGQRNLVAHLRAHVWMLRVGWARRDGRELAGQVARLLLTPLGHLTGRLPIGNTGGANISAFQPMPIPADLAEILRRAEQAG
jgi:hypothetical protein